MSPASGNRRRSAAPRHAAKNCRRNPPSNSKPCAKASKSSDSVASDGNGMSAQYRHDLVGNSAIHVRHHLADLSASLQLLADNVEAVVGQQARSDEHTSELQSLMRIS